MDILDDLDFLYLSTLNSFSKIDTFYGNKHEGMFYESFVFEILRNIDKIIFSNSLDEPILLKNQLFKCKNKNQGH